MHPPLLSFHTFRLSRLLWGKGEGKTDKAASTEITYHSLAMCSAPLSGKCWICQSGSTAGNMWAQFWGCRFKWVEHRSMGIRAHSLENLKQVMFCSFIYIFIRRITHSEKNNLRSQGIHHWQQSRPDLYWVKIPRCVTQSHYSKYILHGKSLQ